MRTALVRPLQTCWSRAWKTAAGNILAKDFFHLPTRTLRGETDIGLTVEAHASGEQGVQLKNPHPPLRGHDLDRSRRRPDGRQLFSPRA